MLLVLVLICHDAMMMETSYRCSAIMMGSGVGALIVLAKKSKLQKVIFHQTVLLLVCMHARMFQSWLCQIQYFILGEILNLTWNDDFDIQY